MTKNRISLCSGIGSRSKKVAILLLLLFPPTPISYIVCMANNGNTDGGFHVFATRVPYWVGTKRAFLLAMLSIVLWLLSGPYFHYSDTWQLIINTGTTVITFLVVFLIQNTQNRDARAIHEHSRIIQLCNSQLHPITKRFHGHAICRLEWASSFRACRDAGPTPGSCSDQDYTFSAALPQTGQRKYRLSPLFLLSSLTRRPRFRPRPRESERRDPRPKK